MGKVKHCLSSNFIKGKWSQYHKKSPPNLQANGGLILSFFLPTMTASFQPLVNFGFTRQKAKSLASNLSCHAIQRSTTIINTRHALHLQGSAGGGGSAGRVALESRRRRIGRSGAWPKTLLVNPCGIATLPAAAKYPPKQSTEARDVHVLVVVHGTSQTISFVSSPYSSNSLKQSQFFRCGSVSARGLLYLGVFYQAGITCALTVAPNNALTDALNVQ
eukprot:1145346-Pelagomonas_calceolata.AAC.6